MRWSKPGVDLVLGPIALDRARGIGPFVLFAIIVALVTSERFGIPLARPVVVWNAFGIGSLSVLVGALLTRKVPARWGHFVLAFVWAETIGGTMLSQYFSHAPGLTLLTFVEMVAAAIMLDTRYVIALLLAAGAAWYPLDAITGGESAVLYAVSMACTQSFALIFHLLQKKALLQLDELRHAQQQTAGELASQLAELQRSEDERRRLHDQLLHAQRMDAIGTLASGLAHDMNNVLASITSLTEIVREAPNAPTARNDLEVVLAQAARGAALTRSLLAFSRRTEIKKRVFAISKLVRESGQLLARTLPKHIAVETTIESEDLRVDGDPGQLQQILINLGVNAADAMQAGSHGRLQLACATRQLDEPMGRLHGLAAGDYVEIRVIDSGTGIDPERLQRVFEPFFTTKPLGKGTGLGLATAWGIAKSHDGTLTVASTLGEGSTFTVYLPRCNRLSRPLPRAISPALPEQGATVLVIDDEEAVRMATMRTLTRRGLMALGAENGEVGLRVFREHAGEIDLVLLDMGMPVMGGRECFTRLREISQVPVLIASGYALEEEARELIEKGATLLEKPYPTEQLMREVAKLLAQRNPR